MEGEIVKKGQLSTKLELFGSLGFGLFTKLQFLYTIFP